MKDDPLPPTDHVSRYCSASFLSDDGRPSQTAFFLDGDDCVSVNWLEHTGLVTRPEQINAIRKALTRKGLKLRKSGRFAVLNVGDLIGHLRATMRQDLVVSHQPELPEDPSHSGIFYPSGTQPFVEFLATRVAERVLEMHLAT